MQKICELAELEDGESRQFEVQGHAIFLVRQGGEVWGYHNRCPHRGIPLEWVEHQFLDYERQFIQCATHGALFTIDKGECVHGPCLGQSLQPLALLIDQQSVWLRQPVTG